MDAYNFEIIPELTEEEKKSPYASFYYIPVGKPLPHIYEAIQPGRQMDPALAINLEDPEDVKKMFLPEGIPCKNGWCVMPDGTGFSAIETPMPEVTPEIDDWWFSWFTASDLNYKIWLPKLHFRHKSPIYEDLGWGPLYLTSMKQLTPEMLGIKNPKELDPDFIGMQAPSLECVSADNPDAPTHYAILIHCIKRMEGGGIRFQTLVYTGVKWEDGKLVRMIPENETVDPERVRLFATHNAYEFARKAEILPGLYKLSKTL